VHDKRNEGKTFLYIVPVEMSTLMSILPMPGRTDWKYPRPRRHVNKKERVRMKIELTELETSADVLGLAVGEERAHVEGVRQGRLHADNDIEGLKASSNKEWKERQSDRP